MLRLPVSINMKQKLIIFLSFAIFASNHSFAQNQENPSTGNVAILIFNGVQIIDYTGPYETLSYGFNVFTVANKMDTVFTNGGMKVIPNYDFKNCPPADIIVVPGGNGVANAMKQPEIINWIQEASKKTKIVMSVCNGAFFLAKAGLLNNLEVTTTAGYIDSLQSLVPSAHVVRDKRFVDNGKIITTAGLSSGIDGALHAVSRLLGTGWEPVFARFMEYDWKPDSKYAAGMLADCNAWKVNRFLWFNLNGDCIKYEVDTKHLNCEVVVKSEMGALILLSKINATITKEEKWKLKNSDESKGISTWSFTGKDKNNWSGLVKVSPAEKAGEYKVWISIIQG